MSEKPTACASLCSTPTNTFASNPSDAGGGCGTGPDGGGAPGGGGGCAPPPVWYSRSWAAASGTIWPLMTLPSHSAAASTVSCVVPCTSRYSPRSFEAARLATNMPLVVTVAPVSRRTSSCSVPFVSRNRCGESLISISRDGPSCARRGERR